MSRFAALALYPLWAVAVTVLAMERARDNARVCQRNADWLANPHLDFIVCHFGEIRSLLLG